MPRKRSTGPGTGTAQAYMYRRSEAVFALVVLAPNLTSRGCYEFVQRTQSEGNGAHARILMEPISCQQHVAVVVVPQSAQFNLTDDEFARLLRRTLPDHRVTCTSVRNDSSIGVLAAHLLQAYVRI